MGGDKAWKDIWGAGQGIGAVTSVSSAATYIEKLKAEYLLVYRQLQARMDGDGI